MADFWTDDENDDFDEEQRSDGPADLRKAHRAATRKLKELEKQLAERDEQIKSLSGQVRGKSISDVLQAKGVNPKVAKLIPDDVEPSEESVSKWLDDWADVFNINVPDTANASDDAGGSQETQANELPNGVSQDDLTALEGVLSAGDGGGSPVPAGAVSKLLSDVEGNAKSLDDVIGILNKYGISTVDGY